MPRELPYKKLNIDNQLNSVNIIISAEHLSRCSTGLCTSLPLLHQGALWYCPTMLHRIDVQPSTTLNRAAPRYCISVLQYALQCHCTTVLHRAAWGTCTSVMNCASPKYTMMLPLIGVCLRR